MKKELEELDEVYAKSEEANNAAQNRIAELSEEAPVLKGESDKLKPLAQKQDKTIAALRASLKEDREIISRMEAGKAELVDQIAKLEKMVSELAEDLNREKKNTAELEELIFALNNNRKTLEDKIEKLLQTQAVHPQKTSYDNTPSKPTFGEEKSDELGEGGHHHTLRNVATTDNLEEEEIIYIG